jgi:predicted kinase
VPRLIHLNGPPGVGKSTLARMYIDDHPGTLNLDIDELRPLIGGWRDQFGRTGELVRPLALSMARTHLGAGHDVILPQYLGDLGEVQRFERAASSHDADFVEIFLMIDKQLAIDRFAARAQDASRPWNAYVDRIVEAGGGPRLLADIHDRLSALLYDRPAALVVDSAGGVADSYASLVRALSPGRDADRW